MDWDVGMIEPESTRHQQISSELCGQLSMFLKGKPFQAFAAPFGVKLQNVYDDVLLPDIVVICDRKKIVKEGCVGAPDLVIEILSPSTARHDRFIKYNKYLYAGVREYWIVDPETNTVSVNVLKNGEWTSRAYGESDTVPVTVLPDCEIEMKEVFAEG